jgi:uncharacterized protein
MKIKKNSLYIAFGIMLVSVFLFYILILSDKAQLEAPTDEEKIELYGFVDSEAFLHYPEDRGEVLFKRENYSDSEYLVVSKIEFQSFGTNVHALLVTPKNVTGAMPGIVLMPGAGVSKEIELGLAKKIASYGISVLTFDPRGIGETKGVITSIEQDLAAFANAQQPYQHLVIYDALRAFDLMREAPFIDQNNIILAGESFGARIAIIAAAIDPRIKGVLAISASGFNIQDSGNEARDIFLKSIDADHYIRKISPRKAVMIHNINDTTIPLSLALKTHSKAEGNIDLFLVEDGDCNHGYCESMNANLVRSLKILLEN